MRESACIIVTRAICSPPIAARTPLECFVLAASLAPEWSRSGKPRVWWVESDGRSRILTGLFEVAGVSIEQEKCDRRTGVRLLIDERTAERITWSEGRSRSLASVDYPLPYSGIVAISEWEEARLEEVRESVSTVVSMPVAQRQLSKLFAKTLRERPAVSPSLSIGQAYSYARRYFARNDLFKVDDLDPFDVAAQALLTKSPVAFRFSTETLAEFHEFESGQYQGHDTTRSINTSVSPRDELERSTRRHMLIVEELASLVGRLGLKPRSNRQVDLEASGNKSTILFEIKTCTQVNFIEQLRSAVGQLLEYGYRLRMNLTDKRRVFLVAVLERIGDGAKESFARSFLKSIGVELIFWQGVAGGFEGLDALFGCDVFGQPTWPRKDSVSNGEQITYINGSNPRTYPGLDAFD